MAYTLPLRVLVKGPSNVGWASPMKNSRENLNFPRVLESELLQTRPALVRTISVPSERIKTALLKWEAEMIGDSPDVVVLAYGNYECIHFVLPWWLERHANSNTTRPRKLFRLYRQHLLRPVWRTLAQVQLWLDTHVDPLFFRSKLDAIVADHVEMIKHIQKLHSPLVYVFQLVPAATRFAPWFPGMGRRVDYVNERLEAAIKQLDNPDVRFFRVQNLVDEFCDGDIDAAMPDGFHFSTDMHRHIGEALARDVAVWADEQPHLARREVS